MPKISHLDDAPTQPLVGDEPFVVVQNGVTVRAPVDQIPINLSFPTIAALEAARPPLAEESVYVEGYYASGDGGGHWRKRGTGYGEILDANGIRWVVSDVEICSKMFGAKFDGITDDSASHQNMIDYCYSNEGGECTINSGSTRITKIILRPKVRVKGSGNASTVLICDGDEIISQNQNELLAGASLQNVMITPYSSASESSDVIKITAAQACYFSDIIFFGFHSGRLIVIESEIASIFADGFLTSSNTIFNSFVRIIGYSCSQGIVLKGKYGSVPTLSPPNSSPFPSVVITQNRYEKITFWNVSDIGVNIVKACDSESFDGLTIYVSEDDARHVVVANDPLYTGNNYVNSHNFTGLVLAKSNSVLSCTLLSGNWSFGNSFYIEHDIDLSDPGITGYLFANSLSFKISGKRINQISNTLMEEVSNGMYYKADNGTVSAPVYSFQGDQNTGLVLVSDGVFGISCSGSYAGTWQDGLVSLGGANGLGALRVITGAGLGNYVDVTSTAPGNAVLISSNGIDDNVSLAIRTKGSGSVFVQSGYGSPSERTIAEFVDMDSSINHIRVAPSQTGEPPTFSAVGDDANIDIRLQPKGSGLVRYGKHSTISSEIVTGYILIKDNNGVTRKIAVLS